MADVGALARTWLEAAGRREALLAAVLAAATVALVRLVAPIGIDTAAHAYQTLRWLQSGFQFWDNYWYDGRYSFIDYSLLYYPIAGLVGELPTVLATVSASGFLFARLVAGRFGSSSPWPARAFAVTAGITVWLSGEYPFALGLALALAALSLRQHRRAPLTALFALATLLASPLAFLFLLMAFAGIALAASWRALSRPDLVIGLGLCALVAAALEAGFPITGSFHFNFWALFQVLGISAIALLASAGLRGVGAIRGVFAAMAGAAVGAYLLPSPLGGNATRLVDYFGAPLVWILLDRRNPRRRRGRLLAGAVAAIVLAGQLAPTIVSASMALDTSSNHASFWQGAIRFLRAHASPAFRVEAVDTADHSDAYYLPAAGIPIVRGWFRQDDFPDNALLYGPAVPAGAYRLWLRRNAVRYVVLPHDELDYSAEAEAALLSSGRSGLVPAYRDRYVTVFRLPHPTPLLQAPPGRSARVLALGHDTLTAAVSGPGRYLLAISYTPYWQITSGGACIAPAGGGFSALVASGLATITLRFDPVLADLLSTPAQSCRTAGGG